jgi:copper chaperone CopZ
MGNINLKIEGMSCQHCVASVEKAIDSVKGVRRASVVVGTATIIYDDSRTDREAIVNAVNSAGYKVTAC